jgi:hypothetical protein
VTTIEETSGDESGLAEASEAGSELVRRIEEEFDVNSLKFRGFHAWPRLRSKLVFAYSDGFYASPESSLKRYRTITAIESLTSIRKEISDRSVESARHLDADGKRHAGKAVAFLGSRPRRTMIEGRSWNILFDPLIVLAQEFGGDFVKLTVEAPDPADAHDSDLIRLDYDGMLDWLAALEAINDLLIAPPAHPREIPGLEAFRALLPPELRAKMSATAIVKDLTFIDRLAVVFRIYLERAMPPCVFISGQRRTNMAMTLAARQMGIPSIDIQHGAAIYGPTGYKWHSWLRMPDDGYELLPDYFWVWSESAADRIRAHANPSCPRHLPVVGGNPVLLREAGYRLPRGVGWRIRRAQKVLLVTLGLLDRDGLPDQLFAAIARSNPRWLWLVRLHPQDWSSFSRIETLRRRLRDGGINNVEIDVASSAPLPALFEVADWHVTPYSSSAVEATAFSLPTVFVHPLARSVFGHLLELDGFFYADSPEAILDRISDSPTSVEPLVRFDREEASELLRGLFTKRPIGSIPSQESHDVAAKAG